MAKNIQSLYFCMSHNVLINSFFLQIKSQMVRSLGERLDTGISDSHADAGRLKSKGATTGKIIHQIIEDWSIDSTRRISIQKILEGWM